MIVAVDAMGGDDAPKVVIQGAVQASIETGLRIVLVGDRNLIQEELGTEWDRDHITIQHCNEVVLMNESPLKAIRAKKDSSIRVTFDLLKNNRVDAVVSAGNSGAIMAAGILLLGKVEGVERPALASILPGDKGRVILIDVGGSVDCRPVNILHFGIMANAFAKSCLGLHHPKVGLLSIGEERGKGNEQVRMAYDLLHHSPLNFIGNVEGRDIFSGNVQIVVCDGFVGNVALKLAEGMAKTVTRRLRNDIMRLLDGKTAATIEQHIFQKLGRTLDYAEYGGAPILGIKGVGIVCHGTSSSKAIKNAIKMAADYAEKNVLGQLTEQIAEFRSGKTN